MSIGSKQLLATDVASVHVDDHSPAERRAALLAAAAALVTVVFWASAFVAIRHVGHQFGPGPVALGRLLVGSAVLGVALVFSKLRGGTARATPNRLRRRKSPTRAHCPGGR